MTLLPSPGLARRVASLAARPSVILLAGLAAALGAQGVSAARRAAVIDMGNLPNYAAQAVPAYITKDLTPPDNAITDEGATLGRVLFHDKRLSSDLTVSCASCHQQALAFGDGAIASAGVNGTTGRHSMRLVNTRFGRSAQMFWDERAANLEAQTTEPIRDHAEMGFSGQDGAPSFEDLLARMESTWFYPPLFQAAFGDPQITEARMQRALAQFVRSIQSFDSRFDEGRALAPNDGAPFPNFTAEENRGKQLFLGPPVFDPQGSRIGGGAGCAGCHQPPEFDIAPNSLSNGVLGAIGGGQDRTNTRSPTLRDMVGLDGVPHGPFMHNGVFTTLEQVVNHYNAIPAAAAQPANRPFVDPRLLPGGNPQRLNLTPQQRTDLVAFMNTLAGSAVTTDERWSDPFDENGELQILGLSASVQGWMLF